MSDLKPPLPPVWQSFRRPWSWRGLARSGPELTILALWLPAMLWLSGQGFWPSVAVGLGLTTSALLLALSCLVAMRHLGRGLRGLKATMAS